MLFVPLLLGAALVLAAPAKRQNVPFIAPNSNGGSNLDVATSDGLGEPLNVIVSALSSAAVLTDDGFLNWLQSINLSTECFGLHLGDPQTANLGDGQGFVDQVEEYREDFGNPDFGEYFSILTCLESLVGGNHLRMWRQSTTGALFLAVSHEEDLDESHTISPNGYNLGRDELVSSAIAGSSHNGVTYTATVESVSGLLAPGTTGVNHNISQDGIVKVLTVTIV